MKLWNFGIVYKSGINGRMVTLILSAESVVAERTYENVNCYLGNRNPQGVQFPNVV